MPRKIAELLSCPFAETVTGAFMAFAVLAGSAGAADAGLIAGDLKKLSLEELMNIEVQTVYSASKYEQKITEAPSSVTIITSADIRKYGYRTLADILRSVRSFFITYDRNYTYVGVRGFGRPGDYNGRILLLIDGHRTNDNIYDQAFVGTEGIIDVDLIDRVEVVHGPGSSLYGNNAFFAVVNIVTKQGQDFQGTQLSVEAARYDTYKGRISYGNQFSNGFEAIVSGTGYDSKGQQLFFEELGAVANQTDYDRYQSFFTKTSLRDFVFEGAYNARTKGIPTGAFETDFNDPGNKTIDGHAYGDLKYSVNLGGETNLTARVYYDYYWYEGDYIAGGVTQKDLGYGNWWGSEVKMSSRLFDTHRVIMGVELTDNVRQDQKNFDVAPYSLNLDDRRRSRIWAAYLQDEFEIGRNIIMNAGVRYDRYSNFGGTTNPRLALIHNPTERSTVKLLYGSAFRTPNVFELYYSTPPVNVPNPDLKPEKIKTYELAYEYHPGKGFRVGASGFYYRIKDLINQVDTAAGTTFENVDQVVARGAELSLAGRRQNGTEGRFSYTIQHTEDKLTGEPLTNSPRHLVKVNISAPIVKENVYGSVEEQYTNTRRTEAGQSTQGFYLTNVTLLARNYIDRLEVSASIYNLLDTEYRDPVSADLQPLDTVRQDGRTYRLKVSYSF